MPEYFDDCIYEPSAHRRKYKVYKCCKSDSALDKFGRNNRKHWTVLVAFTPLENVWEEEPTPEGPQTLAGGHRPSFRGGAKLARRARSFKDDFLGRLSQMRSPQGVSPRGGGPRASKDPDAAYCNKGPERELDGLWKQAQIALKHFRDVVSKKKLEMLPGNGTIILDTVWMINISVKSSVPSDSSSSIISCTNRMYQSVARLIKLCDDVLIDDTSSELDNENVNEIVAQVEDSVKCLIELAQEKIAQQHRTTYKTTPRSSYGGGNLDAPAQRNSLPDIPLTPREREILAQTSCALPNRVRGSHSTESILREPSPPPKPPLPGSLRGSETNNCVTPPPLPPKKKATRFQQLTDGCYSNDSSPIATSLERVSMRSKSPEDSSSLFSEGTGSIDSVLNHSSREEDEIKVLMDCDDMFIDNHGSDIFGHNSWEEPLSSSSNHNSEGHISVNEYQRLSNTESDYHRLSNTDSGIMSVHSNSFSKRSSQQSSVSSQFASTHMSKFSNTNTSEMVKSESIVHNLNSSFENQLSVTKSSTNSSSLTVVSSNNRREELKLFGEVPPAIPEKKSKKKTAERQPSPYDNVSQDDIQGELLVTCERHQSHQSFSNTSISTCLVSTDGAKPPPLPPKKKHIMAYMEMFGNCSHTNAQDFMRHSVHMAQSQQWPAGGAGSLTAAQSCSFGHSSSYGRSAHAQSLNLPGGATATGEQRVPSPLHSPHTPISSSPSAGRPFTPPALPPKQRPRKSSAKSPPNTPTGDTPVSLPPPSPLKALPDLLEHTAVKNNEEKAESEVNKRDVDLMEELNVDEHLVMKKPDEEGPDIRGGAIDALIIQATKATKNGVFTYQEAFLTTYRTFITPHDLISKLIKRYNHFYFQPEKKPRSREAFALIVRIVSDLTCLDLNESLQLMLMSFVQQLISCGELTLAKALRIKQLERHEARKQLQKTQNTGIMSTMSLNSGKFTLLDFKSEQIAEQMTLLDADLFMKIEIPEVLIWAQEQNEEKSQNLTRFTEHFNKMSFWARTKILTAETKEVREKYFMKFIKIMKHLRKINNFNSYLALLSALDSAPVRRLEWQKHVQEGLKEYCALIDSSSSFRALRMALAESQPPCIPYIGLVLQDLTFVHIGNSNLLPNGTINFSKRWQQFNIVENMKKFKKATYTFKKQEKIIQFFQNFDDAIGEDAMWKLSETIKPRGGKKAN